MIAFERELPGRERIRIRFLREDVLRVQLTWDEDFLDSGLNRYGFITEPAAPAVRVDASEDEYEASAESSRVRIRFVDSGRMLEITDKITGQTVLRQVEAHSGRRAATARFLAAPDEDWVGFGDQSRERLFHRGHTADCWVSNAKSCIPVPFFMSTHGAAVLVNSTHRVVFDICRTEPSHFSWRDPRGVVDYYVFVGGGFKELLYKYALLTGMPKLPPDWSFGLWHICRAQANDYEMVNDALQFRREGIPCDVLGLESGWMETHYDYSVEKQWSNKRFPIPPSAWTGPANFFNAVKRMGYHMELWLCNRYDLSYEAERRAGYSRPTSKDAEPAPMLQGAQSLNAHSSPVKLQDSITKPGEPWFEHLQKFVDQGFDFFKQDGSEQLDEHPDRLYANGMRDSEMHNLYPLLYARQMYEGFAEYTHRRPVVFTCAGWAGFQAWAGAWVNDTGGGPGALCAMLNTAFAGHSWAVSGMDAECEEGLHFGYLQPWSHINSGVFFRMPWVLGSKLLDMHREYARLRAQLIPYLYSWAYCATQAAVPLMLPLPLEFPDDQRCRAIRHEYLLGRDLLVAAYQKQAYFPKGRWKDYWTGEVLEGGVERDITWPENRGGGLYVREGGIIPLAPIMQYRRERPMDEITLYVFPGQEESSFTLYEDDGVSFAHLDGQCAFTPVTACAAEGRIRIRTGAPEGAYEGQPERRWAFRVAMDAVPSEVLVNGRILTPEQWRYDAARGELETGAFSGDIELEIGL